MNHRLFSLITVFIPCLSLTLISGCASNNKNQIEKTYSTNTIDTIAIIGASTIKYPRMGDRGSVVGLNESKQALDIHLPKVEAALIKKNYNVDYCAKAGVGYSFIDGENWVYQSEDERGDKWQVDIGDVIYEYPDITEDDNYRRAVKKSFERIQAADYSYHFNNFKPVTNEHYLAALRESTNADTICFSRLWGNKYTTARKAGAVAAQVGIAIIGALFGVVAAPGGAPSDSLGFSFTCIDSSSGDVVWHTWNITPTNPIDPENNQIENYLAKFPDKGQPIDQSYQMKHAATVAKK